MHPQVRAAYYEHQQEAQRPALRKRAYVERGSAEDRRARQTLRGLVRQQEALQQEKLAQQQASSVMEPLHASKQMGSSRLRARSFLGGAPKQVPRIVWKCWGAIDSGLLLCHRTWPAILMFFIRCWHTARVDAMREWDR